MGTLLIMATFTVALLVFGIVGYVSYSLFSVFQSTGMAIQRNLGTNSTQSELANTFMGNIVLFSAVLGLLGVVVWGILYSMKRGQYT